MVKFTAFIIVQLNGVENNAQSSCAIILSKAFVVFAVETSIAHSVAHNKFNSDSRNRTVQGQYIGRNDSPDRTW